MVSDIDEPFSLSDTEAESEIDDDDESNLPQIERSPECEEIIYFNSYVKKLTFGDIQKHIKGEIQDSILSHTPIILTIFKNVFKSDISKEVLVVSIENMMEYLNKSFLMNDNIIYIDRLNLSHSNSPLLQSIKMFFKRVKLVIENMNNTVTNIHGSNRKLQTCGLRKCGKCNTIFILSTYYTQSTNQARNTKMICPRCNLKFNNIDVSNYTPSDEVNQEIRKKLYKKYCPSVEKRIKRVTVTIDIGVQVNEDDLQPKKKRRRN